MVSKVYSCISHSRDGEESRCAFCGRDGIVGKDLVETGYKTSLGNDIVVDGCKDLDACFERGGSHIACYY